MSQSVVVGSDQIESINNTNGICAICVTCAGTPKMHAEVALNHRKEDCERTSTGVGSVVMTVMLGSGSRRGS
jgi:hypothetical protein